MSASVPASPLQSKAALGGQVAQQFPATQAKKASMSASVPLSPSPLKSLVQQAAPGQILHRANGMARTGGLEPGMNVSAPTYTAGPLPSSKPTSPLKLA